MGPVHLFSERVFSAPQLTTPVLTGIRRESAMRRFSGHFWFTAFAGIILSGILNLALVGHLNTQLGEMVALCTPQNDSCSGAAIEWAFRAFCLMAVAGTVVVFWLAHRIGRSFVKPAVPDGTL
jgi:hypothetical protein